MRVRSLLIALLLAGCATAQGPSPEQYDAKVKPADRDHWSFRPVRPVAVPVVKEAAWVRTPIDAFVRAKLEARGWKPAPPAEPRAILRRLYLDLTGLPP